LGRFALNAARKAALVVASGAIAVATLGALAQGPGRKARPALVVREVDADAMLLSFGVDTVAIRRALVTTVRGAGRLAPGAADTIPGLDVSIRAMRSMMGGPREPIARVHVEVGRNLVENGRATEPLWEESVTLDQYPTWREVSANALREAVAATNRYLLSDVRRRPH